MMMVVSRCDEYGAIAITLGDMESQDITVKSKRPFQIGDLEMNMADSHCFINWAKLHFV